MRRFFTAGAFICMLLWGATLRAATHEFVLNKPVSEVAATLSVNGEAIRNKLKSETLEKGKTEFTAFYSEEKGWYFGSVSNDKILANTPKGDIKCFIENRAMVNLNGCVRIESKMQPNETIEHYYMVLELFPENGKTRIVGELNMEVDGVRQWMANVHSRISLKKIERVLRELLNDPLPDDK